MNTQTINDEGLGDFSSIPKEMQNARRWLVRAGKVPYYTNGNPRGRTDTPEDWGQLATLTEAVEAYRNSEKFTGVGFALGPDGSGSFWQGIDIDKVSQHRELAHLMSEPNSYSEISPSGDGIHIIGFGQSFATLGPKLGCEAYSQGRFFTFTGKSLGVNTISDIYPLVEKLINFRGGAICREEVNEKDPFASYVTPNIVRDLRSALAYIESDDRQVWVDCAHALKDLGEEGKELWVEWSQRSFKFDESDADRVWKSVKPRSMDYRWVFSTAQKNGWANPIRRKAANDALWNDPEISSDTINLLPISELVQNLRPSRWLIENYLEEESLCLLFGDPGSGKSFLAIDWALSVATGQQWAENNSQQGPIIYVAGEGHTNLAKRFLAWGKDRDIDVKGLPVYFTERSTSLTDERSAIALANAIDQVALRVGSPKLLVIDTLHRNFGDRDENSAQDFGAFVQNVERYLLKRFNTTVLIVHHSGHGDKKRSRGSSSIKASLDWEYLLEKSEISCTLINKKVKDNEPPKPVGFKLKKVVLEIDEQLRANESLVLVEYRQLEPGQLSSSQTSPEQTKGSIEEKLARNILDEMLCESCHTHLLPDGTKGDFVKKSSWREACLEAFLEYDEDRSEDSTKRAVGRAINLVLKHADIAHDATLVGFPEQGHME